MTLDVLPIKPNAKVRAAYVARILRVWNQASIVQLDSGRDWYPAAHRFAAELGDVRMAAGVIAALSPQKQWSENVRLARLAFERGYAYGQVGDATRKADAILAGVDPETVLPMAAKTGQFFRCIFDPDDRDAVVVDRHAYDIVAGVKFGELNRGLSANGRYASVADAYREAAQSLGEVPCVVQATTWTVQTDATRYARSLRGDRLAERTGS